MQKFDPSKHPQPAPMSRINEPAIREGIRRCTLVVGVDPRDNTQALFYGKETIERMAKDAAEGRADQWDMPSVIRFMVDFETDEPETLAAAVTELRGSTCYAR